MVRRENADMFNLAGREAHRMSEDFAAYCLRYHIT